MKRINTLTSNCMCNVYISLNLSDILRRFVSILCERTLHCRLEVELKSSVVPAESAGRGGVAARQLRGVTECEEVLIVSTQLEPLSASIRA